jgi:hypothetical protein
VPAEFGLWRPQNPVGGGLWGRQGDDVMSKNWFMLMFAVYNLQENIVEFKISEQYQNNNMISFYFSCYFVSSYQLNEKLGSRA